MGLPAYVFRLLCAQLLDEILESLLTVFKEDKSFSESESLDLIAYQVTGRGITVHVYDSRGIHVSLRSLAILDSSEEIQETEDIASLCCAEFYVTSWDIWIE